MAERQQGSALVIGGSGGIGSPTCVELSRCWSRVLVGYRTRAEAAERVVNDIEAAGGSAQAVAVDVDDVTSLGRAVDAAEAVGGRLGALVFTPRVERVYDFVSKVSPADLVRVLNDDVVALLTSVQVALPALRRSKGTIVAVSTFQVARPEIRGSLNAVPKAAVEQLITSIAKEEGRYGIRANAVRIGWTEIGAAKAMLSMAGGLERKQNEIPLRRLAAAREVAGPIAFLTSEAAGFITGAVLPIDGGETL